MDIEDPQEMTLEEIDREFEEWWNNRKLPVAWTEHDRAYALVGYRSRSRMVEKKLDKFKRAYLLMREASYQSHDGHWRGHGMCQECIRAAILRTEAAEILEEKSEHRRD